MAEDNIVWIIYSDQNLLSNMLLADTSSPFLNPGDCTQENQLVSLHLRRDLALPTVLSRVADSADGGGYAEGVVTNTRFGSFPHSTLIDLRWGSQVRASQVDTGTRGRKRKAAEISNDAGKVDEGEQAPKEATAAASGFIHVLPPTPENWTTSLPHRTQVVYTPDYSYILHRIRARPGSIVIEAGSGSGSFTHAAARAVFNGYGDDPSVSSRAGLGKVYSYEFHAERHKKIEEEMRIHGLETIVTTTHRDVCESGFLLADASVENASPQANAIFLDLPAPWEALPHLVRDHTSQEPSSLDPSHAVYVCTFSPCIEQAQKTISVLRRQGWLEIEMVEMQQRRVEVRREYTGIDFEGMRGVNAVAADVGEALAKLREVEKRAQDFHTGQKNPYQKRALSPSEKAQEPSKVLFKEGRLVHRSEPELKTHTSYLVFAVLPRKWSEQDEAQALLKWSGNDVAVSTGAKSQRQLKREAKKNTQTSQDGREDGSGATGEDA